MARKGPVKWSPPADGGKWQVMEFRWESAPRLKQGKRLAIDGMSRDCVDWYIKTVYEPHHARFGGDFGKTIPGFFYDEPETPGDWGTELNGEKGITLTVDAFHGKATPYIYRGVIPLSVSSIVS